MRRGATPIAGDVCVERIRTKNERLVCRFLFAFLAPLRTPNQPTYKQQRFFFAEIGALAAHGTPEPQRTTNGTRRGIRLTQPAEERAFLPYLRCRRGGGCKLVEN